MAQIVSINHYMTDYHLGFERKGISPTSANPSTYVPRFCPFLLPEMKEYDGWLVKLDAQ